MRQRDLRTTPPPAARKTPVSDCGESSRNPKSSPPPTENRSQTRHSSSRQHRLDLCATAARRGTQEESDRNRRRPTHIPYRNPCPRSHPCRRIPTKTATDTTKRNNHSSSGQSRCSPGTACTLRPLTVRIPNDIAHPKQFSEIYHRPRHTSSSLGRRKPVRTSTQKPPHGGPCRLNP